MTWTRLTGQDEETSEERILRESCAAGAAQLAVGDVDGNTSRVIATANRAREKMGADVVMVPEPAVSDYPPEHFLFHSGMRALIYLAADRCA